MAESLGNPFSVTRALCGEFFDAMSLRSETTKARGEGCRQVKKGDNIDPDPHGDKSSDAIQKDIEVGEFRLKVAYRLNER